MAGEWRTSTWGEEISLEYGKALRCHDEAQVQYRVFGANGPIGWASQPLVQGPGVILGRKGAYRGVQYSPEPFFVIDTAYYVAPKSELDPPLSTGSLPSLDLSGRQGPRAPVPRSLVAASAQAGIRNSTSGRNFFTSPFPLRSRSKISIRLSHGLLTRSLPESPYDGVPASSRRGARIPPSTSAHGCASKTNRARSRRSISNGAMNAMFRPKQTFGILTRCTEFSGR